MSMKVKIVVSFSGGKDSHDSLIYAVNKWGAKNIEAVFCDTKWEHALLYPFIEDVCSQLNVRLTILQSEYSFLELAIKKKRFPSTKARFCTEKLKVEPMIDFILTQLETVDYMIVVQGIRKQESVSRSKMEPHCQYFKYYFTPYGTDKDGKPKYFTYRKKDIVRLDALSRVDVERPVFEKTAAEVINSILDAGQKPNPLYYFGVGRVGCFPCIMVNHKELFAIIDSQPDYARRVIESEKKVKSSFFPPTYIPKRYHDKSKNGKTYASAERVFYYIRLKNQQGKLYDEKEEGKSCMTAFNICE